MICSFCSESYELKASKLSIRKSGLCPACVRMDIIEQQVIECTAEIRDLLVQQNSSIQSLMSLLEHTAAVVEQR